MVFLAIFWKVPLRFTRKYWNLLGNPIELSMADSSWTSLPKRLTVTNHQKGAVGILDDVRCFRIYKNYTTKKMLYWGRSNIQHNISHNISHNIPFFWIITTLPTPSNSEWDIHPASSTAAGFLQKLYPPLGPTTPQVVTVYGVPHLELQPFWHPAMSGTSAAPMKLYYRFMNIDFNHLQHLVYCTPWY